MSNPLFGKVTHPKDMMEAARKSLSEQAFKDLMEQTGGRAPTPDELCAMVDAIRQAQNANIPTNQYLAALSATAPAVISSIVGNTTH
jgi:hypothetical protein